MSGLTIKGRPPRRLNVSTYTAIQPSLFSFGNAITMEYPESPKAATKKCALAPFSPHCPLFLLLGHDTSFPGVVNSANLPLCRTFFE